MTEDSKKELPKPTLQQEKKVKLIYQIMSTQIQCIEFLPEEYQGVSGIVYFLKALIDKKLYVPPGKTELDVKKMAHDNYLTIAHILSTRCRLKFKDLAPIVEAINFANEMANVLKKEIELVEPPKEQPKEKPYVMDLTHVKPTEGMTDVQNEEISRN